MRNRYSKESIRDSWWFVNDPYKGPHSVYAVTAMRGANGVGYTALPGEVDVSTLGLMSIEEALYELRDYDKLSKDGYDLLKDFKFILVPTIGWSEKGYRVGSGAGFYDRLLAKNNGRLAVIFVTLEKYRTDFQEEPHDVQADFIITERRVYAINK